MLSWVPPIGAWAFVSTLLTLHTVVVATSTGDNTHEDDYQVSAARCQARCSHLYTLQSDIRNCSSSCDAVLTSCTDCKEFCKENEPICIDACNYVHNVHETTSRNLDDDDEKNLPPVPNSLVFREHHHGKVVYFTWSSSFADNHPQQKLSSIVYILQIRSTLSLASNFLNDSWWETLTRTSATTVILKEVLLPGRYYQFRVAAVSENGTRGFSEESEPFILSIAPRAAGPPQNFKQDLTEIDGSPVVRWEPPSSTDLPIFGYRISWVRRLRTVHMLPANEKTHQRVLPAKQVMFILKYIEQQSIYQVQIQAITMFKNRTINGEKATLYINTFTESNSISNVTLGEYFPCEDSLCTRLTWSKVKPTEGKMSIVQQYIAFWKNNCSSHASRNHSALIRENELILNNLHPACNYSVAVETFAGQTTWNTKLNHFVTPSCKALTFPLPMCQPAANSAMLSNKFVSIVGLSLLLLFLTETLNLEIKTLAK